ncbi:MAG: ribosome biogenesis GTP-binding protein YihA/YsxC [Pseudomonadota bacterium]
MQRSLAGGRLTFLGSFPRKVPLQALPEVAVAGRSNVGKSSCLNRLVGVKQAARVSSTPGRTQAINLFQVEQRYILADLPGYGFAKVPEGVQRAWKGLVEGYLSDERDLRLVILLVDPRREPGGMDADLLWSLRETRIPVQVVATKIDKLTRAQARTALARLATAYGVRPDDLIGFSALKGDGVEELDRAIAKAVARSRGPER